MLLQPTEDQAFFHETTTRFLDEFAGVAQVRAFRHDPVGHDRDLWRRGAELGWTSFLVDERHGGGSVSGAGLVDLTLVAHEFGHHAAPGPLIPCNVVAGLLSRADAHHDTIAALLAGTTVAAWALAEPVPHDALGTVTLEVREDGDELVLTGSKRPVEAAVGADVFLVTGRSAGGLTNVLVPSATPGLTVTPLKGIDISRRFATVTFDEVRVPRSAVVGSIGGAADGVEWGRLHSIVIACAESVGAMQHGFDMTVEWSFDRYSFGRPLASYQALKHRFADMKTWLEASHAITDEAAAAVAADRLVAPAAGLAVALDEERAGEARRGLHADADEIAPSALHRALDPRLLAADIVAAAHRRKVARAAAAHARRVEREHRVDEQVAAGRDGHGSGAVGCPAEPAVANRHGELEAPVRDALARGEARKVVREHAASGDRLRGVAIVRLGVGPGDDGAGGEQHADETVLHGSLLLRRMRGGAWKLDLSGDARRDATTASPGFRATGGSLSENPG